MKYNRLGNSELMVSEICLGTMTWGVQNTEEDAHAQIDYARSCGINMIDTAELYPVPNSAPGQIPGTTERYIGTYLAAHPEARSELIIATKVTGFSVGAKTTAYRTDPPSEAPHQDARHDAESIKAACNGSLRRLQTDYIDVYQLHWPDRYVPLFGSREYRMEQVRKNAIPFKDILLGIKELLDEGKIRYWGLSNETTFGVCEFVRVAKEIGMAPPISIQNEFSLINRRFESELAEACAPHNFNIGLLPWSVLSGGVLTGKYKKYLDFPDDMSKAREGIEDCRFAKYSSFQPRFTSKPALEAVEKYRELATEYDMSLPTLAQAFCKSRWYIPTTIIGATKMDQLKENIKAFEIDLDAKILKKIDDIHKDRKDPVVTL